MPRISYLSFDAYMLYKYLLPTVLAHVYIQETEHKSQESEQEKKIIPKHLCDDL